MLLAELTVPIAAVSPGSWTVPDSPAVLKNEETRPYVVHLRLLQELLLCGPSCCTSHLSSPPAGGVSVQTGGLINAGSATSLTNVVERPAGLPRYEIVAAGIVNTDGTSRATVYNNLRATVQSSGEIALNFSGYTPPTANFQYIVKAMVVTRKGAEQAVVTFSRFLAARTGILLNVLNVDAEIRGQMELVVEISRYEASEREVALPVPLDAEARIRR